MEDLKALTECAECTWDYIDRLRMALASACKARDEARKELHETSRNLLLCGTSCAICAATTEMLTTGRVTGAGGRRENNETRKPV